VIVAVEALGERAYLVRDERLLAWSPRGYGERRRPKGAEVKLLTPPSTVATIRAGYAPEVHAWAQAHQGDLEAAHAKRKKGRTKK
jgi:hypothetical protein